MQTMQPPQHEPASASFTAAAPTAASLLGRHPALGQQANPQELQQLWQQQNLSAVQQPVSAATAAAQRRMLPIAAADLACVPAANVQPLPPVPTVQQQQQQQGRRRHSYTSSARAHSPVMKPLACGAMTGASAAAAAARRPLSAPASPAVSGHPAAAAAAAATAASSPAVDAYALSLAAPRSATAALPLSKKVKLQLAGSSGRILWTAELHALFLSAVEQLGGAEQATPNEILNIMSVEGLSRENVKSHLQKHRQTVRETRLMLHMQQLHGMHGNSSNANQPVLQQHQRPQPHLLSLAAAPQAAPAANWPPEADASTTRQRNRKPQQQQQGLEASAAPVQQLDQQHAASPHAVAADRSAVQQSCPTSVDTAATPAATRSPLMQESSHRRLGKSTDLVLEAEARAAAVAAVEAPPNVQQLLLQNLKDGTSSDSSPISHNHSSSLPSQLHRAGLHVTPHQQPGRTALHGGVEQQQREPRHQQQELRRPWSSKRPQGMQQLLLQQQQHSHTAGLFTWQDQCHHLWQQHLHHHQRAQQLHDPTAVDAHNTAGHQTAVLSGLDVLSAVAVEADHLLNADPKCDHQGMRSAGATARDLQEAADNAAAAAAAEALAAAAAAAAAGSALGQVEPGRDIHSNPGPPLQQGTGGLIAAFTDRHGIHAHHHCQPRCRVKQEVSVGVMPHAVCALENLQQATAQGHNSRHTSGAAAAEVAPADCAAAGRDRTLSSGGLPASSSQSSSAVQMLSASLLVLDSATRARLAAVLQLLTVQGVLSWHDPPLQVPGVLPAQLGDLLQAAILQQQQQPP